MIANKGTLVGVRRVFVICGVTLSLCAMVGEAHATVLFQDNFDSYPSGDIPSPPWTSEWSATSNTYSVSSPNSFWVTSPAGYAYKTVSPISLASSGEVRISYDVLVNTETTLHRMMLYNSSLTGVLGTVWMNSYDGTISAVSGLGSVSGTVVPIGSLSLNTWYSVTMSFMPENGYFDVTVYQGATLIGAVTGVSFDLPGNTALADNPDFGAIYISNGFSTGDAYTYTDNVLVQAIPEPSMTALLALGGAAVFGFAWRRARRGHSLRA